MSKFEKIINTFKNGMVSPRLRGAVVEPSDSSSAETLENFIVDRTGSAIKRPGIALVSKSTNTSTSKSYYKTELLGTEYLFSFDSLKTFNAVDASYNSTFAQIVTPTSPVPPSVKVFGTGRRLQNTISSWSFVGPVITLTIGTHTLVTGDTIVVAGLLSSTNAPNTTSALLTAVTATTVTYTFSATPTGSPTVDGSTNFINFLDSLALWNGKHSTNGSFTSSGLDLSLTFNLNIIHAEKISDRTVVFTTDNFSFLLSLLDYSTPTNTIRQFYIYPYYVSSVLLLQTLGKSIGDAVKCPICPSNYPFNPVNTDTTLSIAAATYSLSGTAVGSAPTSGVVIKSNEKFVYTVTIPLAVLTINGTLISLSGRFISVPSSDTTKDVVFYLAYSLSSTATTATYYAIQVIGGTPSASVSTWKLSSWGSGAHPRSVGFCFARLYYGNTALSPSQWWASALHPDNRQYFQGFSIAALLQDASSDASGINYAGVALASVTTPTARTAVADIFRFGFNDFTPTFGAINWITSRRRVHLGTSKGESQITAGDGNYNQASYSQNITGTDKSVLGGIATGSRRIFYIANEGKDIRSISTEDKDYESVDTLLSVSMEGLDLYFTKIHWWEAKSTLICHSRDRSTGVITVYFLALHPDTGVKAFSKLVTTKVVQDAYEDYIVLKDSTYNYVGLVYPYSYIADAGITKNCYGDLYTVLLSKADIATGSFANYYSTAVTLYHLGISYPFTVPSGVFSPALLPFDPDTITFGDGGELYVIADTYTAKIKSLPIHEGAKFGSSVGDVQRVDRITVLIDGSGPFKYGAEESNLMDSENVAAGDTKLVTIEFPQSPDREQFIHIQSSDPTPLNISGISLRGVSYSGE